jgi:hypothetical protein
MVISSTDDAPALGLALSRGPDNGGQESVDWPVPTPWLSFGDNGNLTPLVAGWNRGKSGSDLGYFAGASTTNGGVRAADPV